MKTLYTTLAFLLVLTINFAQHPRMDVNYLNAVVIPNSTIFQDTSSTVPGFEILAGTNRSTIYASNIWIGGLKPDSSLAVSFNTFLDTTSQSSFLTGPLTIAPGLTYGPATIDSATAQQWNKVFVVTRAEIEIFKQWHACSQDPTCNAAVVYPGYLIPSSISTWPAHGDVAMNQAYYLAPFYDKNSDGDYNPNDGDFPCIKGDKYAWYILNDARFGTKVGAEIHVEMYAYDLDSISPIGRTIYMGYDIINRSTTTYTNFITSIQSDLDIGSGLDDYVGSMVGLNSYYAYNADAIDDNPTGGRVAFGANPPAQGVTFLNQSMNTSMYFINSANATQGDPDQYNMVQAYRYMNGIWKDGNPLYYGGNGYPGFPGVTTTLANHPFPYLSQFGTNPWTEASAVNPLGDRRMLGSTAGITFSPGDKIELDVAYTFTRSGQGNIASVDTLYRDIQLVQSFYNDSILPCSDSLQGTLGIEKNELTGISIFPNPTHDNFTLRAENKESLSVIIMDARGKVMQAQSNVSENKNFSLSQYSEGIYLIKVYDEQGKFIVLRIVKN